MTGWIYESKQYRVKFKNIYIWYKSHTYSTFYIYISVFLKSDALNAEWGKYGLTTIQQEKKFYTYLYIWIASIQLLGWGWWCDIATKKVNANLGSANSFTANTKQRLSSLHCVLIRQNLELRNIIRVGELELWRV